MKTKVLLSVSAFYLFMMGMLFSFLPQETLVFLGGSVLALPVLLVQAAGALYLGFAFLNWTARGTLIGGIYNRPVSLGNFFHFAVGAAALLKGIAGGHREPVVLTTVAAYVIFAVWFGKVVFTHPLSSTASESK